jgi:hypothetical protein
MDYAFLNKQDYKLGYIQENIELIIYSIIAFFAPFMVGHPQWVVGTIVNSSLVLAALNIKNYRLLPIILLPSIAVLTRGLIFGPFTIFLVYLIPFIWMGNAILVLCMKYFKLNNWINMGIGSVLKAAFLFTAAYALVSLKVLPPLFLTTMGLFQLYTAVAGGVLALGVHKIKKRFNHQMDFLS